jgi:hypothetical protein
MNNVKTPSGTPTGRTMTAPLNTAGVVAFKLHVPNVESACEQARNNADKTFAAADASKLPQLQCGINCQCYYERITERRKGPRRVAAERRDMIRFEKKSDRRSGKDRRKGSGWGTTSTV